MSVPLQNAKSATDTAGDLFLSGSYMELGVSAYGNFGTTQGQTPVGYAQAGTQGVGLTYNAAGFGVNDAIPTIDFFTPGGPWEVLAAGYSAGGTTHSGYNYKDGHTQQITSTSLTNTSSGSTLSAEWIGVLNGALRVTVDYSFGAADQFFATTVTLTNISGAAMDDARFDRNVDPDNTQWAGGDYTTINTVVGQEPGSPSEVTATSLSGDAYETAVGAPATFAYYSTDPRVRVAIGQSSDPFNPAFRTGGYATAGTTLTDDTGVNLNFDGGPLADGASVSTTYYTAITSNLDDVLGALGAGPTNLALAAASDSGAAGDRLTNVATPTITGRGAAGDTITLSDGDTVIGTATVVADHTWSITSSSLADGVHHLTATQIKDGGTVSSASAPLGITIDTSTPDAPTELTLAAPSDSGLAGDDITSDTTPTVTGRGVTGDRVTLFDGDTPVGSATVGEDGTWSITSQALADGPRSLTARQTNTAGTPSADSTPLALVIDSSVPAKPADLALAPDSDSGLLGDGLTNSDSLTVNGSGTPGDTVSLFDDLALPGGSFGSPAPLGTAVVGPDGTWSITTGSLAEGPHGLTARQTNPAGTISDTSDPLDVTVDRSVPLPPTGLVLVATDGGGAAEDGVIDIATPVIAGNGIAGDTVTLYDGETPVGTATVDTDGAWSITSSSLADGRHSLVARHTNPAGTFSEFSAPLSITVDTRDYAVTDDAGSTTGTMHRYHGSIPGVQRELTVSDPGNHAITALADNAALQGGPGNDAISAKGGRSVLDGNGGSDWLVGGSGHNSFIVDADGGSWSTIVGIKPGDDITIRGLGDGHATYAWLDDADGVDGAQGATLRGTLDGTGQTYSVTFAGLSIEQAKEYAATSQTDANGMVSLHLQAPSPTPDPATYLLVDNESNSGSTGLLDGYDGPVGFLQHQHIAGGDTPVTLVAQASNAWLKTGSGMDALVVRNGDNVLDGGAGSNWLVGGAGHDTFFVDASAGQPVWDTVLNFHAGDSLTMWGFQQGVSRWGWADAADGAAGHAGATLHGALDGSNTDFSVTLAGVSTEVAKAFTTSTGTSADGVGYLHIQA